MSASITITHTHTASLEGLLSVIYLAGEGPVDVGDFDDEVSIPLLEAGMIEFTGEGRNVDLSPFGRSFLAKSAKVIGESITDLLINGVSEDYQETDEDEDGDEVGFIEPESDEDEAVYATGLKPGVYSAETVMCGTEPDPNVSPVAPENAAADFATLAAIFAMALTGGQGLRT